MSLCVYNVHVERKAGSKLETDTAGERKRAEEDTRKEKNREEGVELSKD